MVYCEGISCQGMVSLPFIHLYGIWHYWLRLFIHHFPDEAVGKVPEEDGLGVVDRDHFAEDAALHDLPDLDCRRVVSQDVAHGHDGVILLAGSSQVARMHRVKALLLFSTLNFVKRVRVL